MKLIISCPTMGSKRQGPILNANIIWATTWNPSRLRAEWVDFWAWAPHILISCCSSTGTGGVTARSGNRASSSWRVPLRPRGNSGLPWAITPNLGLCRLGWSHIARHPAMLPVGNWAWINEILAEEAHVVVGWTWRGSNVHLYSLLRHVISSGGGCGSKSHVRGLTWAHVPNIVRLWWHPTFQPIPTPMCFFTLFSIAIDRSNFISILVCLWKLPLLLLPTKWSILESNNHLKLLTPFF